MKTPARMQGKYRIFPASDAPSHIVHAEVVALKDAAKVYSKEAEPPKWVGLGAGIIVRKDLI